MNPIQDRDESLMAQVALGKRDSLEPLVRRHAGPLLTFICRMVGDRHLGEELFQEVFLAVWVKRQQYQFPRPFRPWLYTIAINKCRGAFRYRVPGYIPLEEATVAPARDRSPPETAIAAETAALVSHAVTQLPTRQRLVVVLRIWNGLSYGEIADILDRSEATVRSHMHHGLIALRKVLEPRLRS